MRRAMVIGILGLSLSAQAAEVTCDAGGHSGLRFRWRAPAESVVSSYRLYRCRAPMNQCEAPIDLALPVPNSDGELQNAAPIDFDLRAPWFVSLTAINEAGEGPRSNEIALPTCALAVPGAPILRGVTIELEGRTIEVKP